MNKEVVSTPSGEYMTCTYRVYPEGGGLFLTLDFTPGVGMVKMKNAFGTSWLMSSEALAEHEPIWPLQPSIVEGTP
ncbi:MAG: hypothetical protein NTX17_09910 [Candidatus Eisenbacteria bacterium]|nr:hypothetical protein [Candidatus Eisenbacteria bacterium]